MTKQVMLVSVWLAVGALSLRADENMKPPPAAISIQRAAFASGGTLRVDGSYDDLYIKGWDQDQVELTVEKFMPFEYDPAHPGHSAKNLETVGVVLEKHSPTELAITTAIPPRKGVLTHFSSRTNHVRIEYHVYVPHKTKLVIQHGVGFVSVENVTGDIDARCYRGDIVVWLRGDGMYAVDAKSKLGKVSSDFSGASLSHFMLGQTFTSHPAQPLQQLRLRVGFGGITLKPILPESESGSAQTGN